MLAFHVIVFPPSSQEEVLGKASFKKVLSKLCTDWHTAHEHAISIPDGPCCCSGPAGKGKKAMEDDEEEGERDEDDEDFELNSDDIVGEVEGEKLGIIRGAPV